MKKSAASNVGPVAESPAGADTTAPTPLLFDDAIFDVVQKIMPTVKAKAVTPDSTGVETDDPLSQAISDGLDTQFHRETFLCYATWQVKEKGAYKDGVTLNLAAEYPGTREIGGRNVEIGWASVNMKPSQTPQAIALDSGTTTSVSGTVEGFSVTAFVSGEIDVTVLLGNGEFH
jgi:hypothetical protein